MPKIWSELPEPRMREIVADLATLAWVLFWGSIAWTLYSFLAGFAEAGRLVRGGGEGLQAAGAEVGGHLGGLPLVGEQVSAAVRSGFNGAGGPIVSAGLELESFAIVVAATLALILVLVPLLPWLFLYLPWRLERIRRLRGGHRAIRRPAAAQPVPDGSVDRVLASRALHRLEWSELLEYSPDPIGDWEAGRFDRLARAEYDSVGLRPRALKASARG